MSTSILYGRMFLVPVLGDFVRRYPDILLDISLTDTVVDIAEGKQTWECDSVLFPMDH